MVKFHIECSVDWESIERVTVIKANKEHKKAAP